MWGLKETWRDHGRCIVISRNAGSQGDMERSWKVYCDVKKCGVLRTHGEIIVFPIGCSQIFIFIFAT